MSKTDRKQESGLPKAKQAVPWWSFQLSMQDRYHRHILLFLLALVLTFIIVPKGGFIPDYYAPGDIASRDIKAPKDLLIPDLPLTEKKRLEAEDAILTLYDFDPRTGQDIADRLVDSLVLFHAELDKGAAPESLHDSVESVLGVTLTDQELVSLAELLDLPSGSGAPPAATPPAPVPPEEPLRLEPLPVVAAPEGEALVTTGEATPEAAREATMEAARAEARKKAAGIFILLRKAVRDALQDKIVGNLQLFQADLERGIVVRNLVSQGESEGSALVRVIGLGEAQELVHRKLSDLDQLSPRNRQILFAVVQKLLRPNLTFNKNETEARKVQARESVKPVLFQVKKGEMIVREGSRVSEEQIRKLKALRAMGSDHSTLLTASGLLLCIVLLLFSSHRFAKRNVSKYCPRNTDLLFLVMTFAGLFVLIKLAIFVSTALESAFPYIDSSSYYYMLPFAVGAMLVRIVLNSETAFVFAIASSLLIGVLFGNSLFITIFALVGSLTGAHWVRHVRVRATLYLAGLRLSLVNVLLILAIQLMAGRALDIQLLYQLGFGLAGGFFCAVIVNGTIPLVEYLFKYTTDIKLLELANMNTPVLRELMIQAPGTYHHSIIVGNLVEAAAEAINANPLLARVAAYYHDVGKIRKPLYFIENKGSEENKHDKLAPSMSALILTSHVKDGVEMARECRLGEPLIDMIRQHHGTALIKFFFDKAKAQADPGVQQVDERDYRYPGPKPQTREAALIMLADAVEAASRTLTDPTPARIRGMVQKIINNIFIDGQLDECELTLKDLHNIAKSFNRILAGIFHQRINYPEPAYKEREKDQSKRKNLEDTNRESAKEAKDREAEPAKDSTEDLKRLGMS